MKSTNKSVQYFVALAVSLAAVSAGVTLTWTTTVIPKFHDNQTDFTLSDSEISWIASISSPGFVVGSLASRFVSDRLGRRATLQASALPMAVGTIIIISTANVWLLCTSKFLWGVGAGMSGTVSAIYLAEIADKEIRGSLSVLSRFMLNFGSFLTLLIGPFVSYYNLNYMILSLPICYLITCSLVPESPYFYLKEGKVGDARKSLIRLRGNKGEKAVEDDLTAMRSDVTKEMRHSGSVKGFFTGKQYRKALTIGVGLKMGQVMSGTIVIQHYLGRIIQDSRYSIDLATVFIVFGALRFLVGVMSSVLADRVGRRPLLIVSFFGTGLSLTLVAVYFFCQEILAFDQDHLSSYAVTVFIGIVLSSVISTLGYSSISYAILGEIFPLNVKSLAMTSLNIFGGSINFLTTKSYQQLKDVSGCFGVFCFFSSVSFVFAVFSYFVMPETKGKSLGEIQVMVQGKYYDDSDVVSNATTVLVGNGTELKPMLDKKS
ncbi:facilitated trehalose transporter Tret1-like [Plodia interpunctella]|uniref:facilitated trehalose transporter Tret1-like n=1 Tax=Plodia interpunctella TaxID=58824 RepID=UPI002368EBBC|nr:facilitated trehalose transporter Tret1-like [Plodia interpunctella]